MGMGLALEILLSSVEVGPSSLPFLEPHDGYPLVLGVLFLKQHRCRQMFRKAELMHHVYLARCVT